MLALFGARVHLGGVGGCLVFQHASLRLFHQLIQEDHSAFPCAHASNLAEPDVFQTPTFCIL